MQTSLGTAHYSLSAGKYHRSIASIGTSVVVNVQQELTYVNLYASQLPMQETRFVKLVKRVIVNNAVRTVQHFTAPYHCSSPYNFNGELWDKVEYCVS